jgi:hypothetical protein
MTSAPTAFPFDTPLAIVEYRDFYDVPHLLLVDGGQGDYWMLDGSFDDVLDDYSPDYTISHAGNDRDAARAYFAAVCAGSTRSDVLARIPCSRVEFDPTRRLELRCHSR